MNVQNYTKREMNIIRAAECPDITEEEFLVLYNKAAERGESEVISLLYDRYPEITDRVFSPEFEDRHRNIADMEYLCPYPVVILSDRYTPGRVMNIVAYLTGTAEMPDAYRERLRSIPHRRVYNYVTAEYVVAYFAEPLWNSFFMGDEGLKRVLERRSIKTMEELVHRSAAYFEDYAGKNHLCEHDSCEQCQRRWMNYYKRSCYEPVPEQP